MGIFNSLYKEDAEVEGIIKQYEKAYAQRAVFKSQLKDIKANLNQELVEALNESRFSYETLKMPIVVQQAKL